MADTIATIRSYARWWAAPDPYKVTGEDLVFIFQHAGCKQIPTVEEASWSADHLMWGCRLGKATRHWCGIFATMVLRYAGVDCHWSLDDGHIHSKSKQLDHIWVWEHGLDGIQPGDVAIIEQGQHHFLIVDNLWDWNGNPLLVTIEGNTTGEKIKSNLRPLHETRPKERIYFYYRLKL